MAYDCPFAFYVSAKSRYCWVFGVAAVVVFLIGAGLFLYAYVNIESLNETRLDLLLQIAGGCVTGVALWLFRECYKHFRPVNFLNSVCQRLGALHAPPETPDKAEQIAILTANGWSVCNEP